MDNYFKVLNAVDCSEKTEKKNGLTYLSWAWAWGEVKKLHPDATYTIYENAQGWNYHSDGRTCWVKTGMTVNGIEHIEYLPVMDFRNASIKAEMVTSFDVNKAIQRSLTKAAARHGLGLYIYAGEDLPEAAVETTPVQSKPIAKVEPKEPVKVTAVQPDVLKSRNAELKALLKDRNKTLDDYKRVAGERTASGMTDDEYNQLLVELVEAWA
jgi:hypothetical protein